MYNTPAYRFDQICGLAHAKRAAEVALTGDHRILFVGCHESDASRLATITNSVHDQLIAKDGGGCWRLAFVSAPCPCGYYGDPDRECTCDLAAVAKWQNEYMNRICPDMVLEVPVQNAAAIMGWLRNHLMDGEPHDRLMVRIECNRADMERLDVLADAACTLLKAAIKSLKMSPNQVKSALSVANTITCMAGAGKIEAAHMAEAIQYRPARLGIGVGG